MPKGSPAPWFRKSRNSWFVTLDPLPAGLRKVWSAQRFDPGVESRFGQEAIQLLIEDVTGRCRQPGRRDPQFLLPFAAPSSQSHRSIPAGVSKTTNGRILTNDHGAEEAGGHFSTGC